VFNATDIAWSIVIPALIGFVLGIACWQPWRRGADKAWAAPLMMGLGFFVAFPVIQNDGSWQWPAMVPRESSEWLVWIAVLATVLGLFSQLVAAPRWVLAIVVLIASAASCGLLLKFKFVHTWSPLRGGLILFGFAVAATVWWAILEAFGEEDPISASILHWLIASCAAVTLMLTGCLTYGKLPFPLAATAGAVCVMSIWRRQKVRINGMPMVFSIVLIATLAGGIFLSSLSLPLLLLVMSSPVLAGFSLLLPQRMRLWQRMLVGILLAAIPLGVAVSMAAKQFAKEQQEMNSTDG
jgi:hypothetical protein